MPIGIHQRRPKSNRERQQAFRKRHPGYFNKYNNRRKTRRKAAKAKWRAFFLARAAEKAAAQADAQTQALPTETQVLSAALALRAQLCLPAPVIDPTLAAINELKSKIRSPLAA